VRPRHLVGPPAQQKVQPLQMEGYSVQSDGRSQTEWQSPPLGGGEGEGGEGDGDPLQQPLQLNG